MSRVQLVNPEQAQGKVKEIFAEITQGFGMVPNLFKAMGHRPEILEANWNKVKAVMMGGELGRDLKEMVAVVVSKANSCQYCVNAHGTALKMIGTSPEIVAQIIENIESADLPSNTKTILQLSREATLNPHKITDSVFDQLKQMGCTDAQIVEWMSVVDLFTSFNKFIDTLELDVDFPDPTA